MCPRHRPSAPASDGLPGSDAGTETNSVFILNFAYSLAVRAHRYLWGPQIQMTPRRASLQLVLLGGVVPGLLLEDTKGGHWNATKNPRASIHLR